MSLYYLTIRYLRKDPPLRIQIELFSPSALAGRSSRALIESDTRSASAFTSRTLTVTS